jgi:phage terminase small subunit
MSSSYLSVPSLRRAKTASACGSRLLGNARVAAYIAVQEALMHRAAIADAAEVREFLTAVMRGEPTEQVPLFVDRGIQELAEAPPGFSSRLRAAELLSRLMGLFTDQVSVKVDQLPKITVCKDGSAFIDSAGDDLK